MLWLDGIVELLVGLDIIAKAASRLSAHWGVRMNHWLLFLKFFW